MVDQLCGHAPLGVRGGGEDVVEDRPVATHRVAGPVRRANEHGEQVVVADARRYGAHKGSDGSAARNSVSKRSASVSVA